MSATGAGFLQRRSAVERDIESMVVEDDEAQEEGDAGVKHAPGFDDVILKRGGRPQVTSRTEPGLGNYSKP